MIVSIVFDRTNPSLLWVCARESERVVAGAHTHTQTHVQIHSHPFKTDEPAKPVTSRAAAVAASEWKQSHVDEKGEGSRAHGGNKILIPREF